MWEKRAEIAEESYSFGDLVDIEAFSKLLDSFYTANGIPNGLVGPKGELITQSGWTAACDLFHRANPDTRNACEHSNLELMQNLQDGEVSGCLCKNGLFDYATPIVIEGQQLATLFLGQVLNAPPDLNFFSEQAARVGFDTAAYLEAIEAIPVVSKQQMNAHMDHIVSVAQVLASNGLASLSEARLKRDLDQSTEQRVHLEDLLKFSPVGISWCDIDGNIEYINHQFTRLFGYQLSDIPNLDTWNKNAYPDEAYRSRVHEPWSRMVRNSKETAESLPELESTIICKDGSKRRIVTRVSWIGDVRLGIFSDITQHWQGEQRSRAHGEILEMIARAEPLSIILHAIVQEIESEEPGALASVLLLDKEGKRLFEGAAPRLPGFYNQAINGIEIGKGVGSCGTAAYLAERVIVEDISTHEYWQPYSELAVKAGLAACWSEPIMGSDGKVLGTFAIYHGIPSRPTADDLKLIVFAANLAAIAIQNHDTREALVQQEKKFRTLAENAPINIARFDQDGRISYLNPKFASVLEPSTDKILDSRLSDLPSMQVLVDALDKTIRSGEEQVFEIEMPGAEGKPVTHLISMVPEQDLRGNNVGVLATGLDISERKRLEQELERQANADFLTGLVNRRHFLELAENELRRFKRSHGGLALILFDIDLFKRINDTHGHSNGDLVLREIARISLESVREIDVVARFGGEEFVVLLPHTSRKEVSEVAERLRQAIADGGVALDNGERVTFTASLGVVSVAEVRGSSETSPSIDELLKHADAAMYSAKKKGRNRTFLADEL